jgi:hypothetical protein
MLINKANKGIQTRSDMPNLNWLGNDWYLVPDNSLLANKIMQYFPRYDFVLDENDNVVDVVQIPKTEEEVNQERIEEIKAELSSLDTTVDRQWEDYYKRENITPVDRIAVVIVRKEELREELKNLMKVGE